MAKVNHCSFSVNADPAERSSEKPYFTDMSTLASYLFIFYHLLDRFNFCMFSFVSIFVRSTSNGCGVIL